MRIAAVVVLSAAAVLAAAAAPAGATNECRGLQVCARVAGPWVVVPAGTTVPRPHVEYQLSCPRGWIVGGLDAELTDPAVDVNFQALIGAPVNPGVSTDRAAVFVATSTRTPPRTSTFRPHIGCIPTSGGGQRIPTVAHVSPPGHPTLRRVWTVRLHPGAQRVVRSCPAGETLVSATHAIGFSTRKPPAAALVASVHDSQSVRAGRVTVSVTAGAGVGKIKAVVQVDAVCGGGR